MARVMCLVWAIVVLGTATVCICGGAQAVREKSYDLPWRSSSGFAIGPVGFSRSASGVEHYRGAAAVSMGVAWSALGAMLEIWGLSILWFQAIFRASGRDTGRPDRRIIRTTLTVVSAVFLATATVGFFPPWQIGTSASATGFYAELFLSGVFLAIPVTHEAARRLWFPIAVSAAIIAGQFSIACAIGIGMGTFLVVFIVGHIMLLFPEPG